MTKLEKYKSWYLNAAAGDKYLYHTGNLVYDRYKLSGKELDDAAAYILKECCKWDLSVKVLKPKDNEPRFKLHDKIILFQKALSKYTKKNEIITKKTNKEKIFCDMEYYALKI